MKRCPECRRDYFDDSLVYCLDDGAPLLEGPGRILPNDEPQTAILHDTAAPSEAATRAQIHTTNIPATRSTTERDRRRFHVKLASIAAAAVVILASGFYGFRYFTASAQINSLAVMPFVNESGNGDIDYLSDGMTESLIRGLSQLPGLNVKARSSVFRYKGKNVDAKTAGNELGVQAVLIGRLVGGRGEQLHLNLELVDVRTENVIWTDDYDRKPSELVTMLNAITRDVSSKIRPASSQKAAKNYTENAEAYQLYLQGRYFWNKRTVVGFRAAMPLFEKALALDPNYALAHSGLSDCYALLAIYEAVPANETMPKAKQEALIALQLDPDLAEAHASLGQVLQNYDFNFAEAEREYKRAIELNPSYASAHQWYGELLSSIGRFDESQASIDRALQLDPFSLVINRMKGSTLVYAGRWDEGLEHMKKVIAMDPNFPGVYYDLFLLDQLKGDYAGSVESYVRYRDLVGDHEGATRSRNGFAKGGWRGFLVDRTTNNDTYATLHHYHLAVFYAALGNRDSAIKELMTSYEMRENDIYWMKVDRRLDPLRDDPRFQELIRKVGFPS